MPNAICKNRNKTRKHRRLQRLEDTVLPDTNGLHVRDDVTYDVDDEPTASSVTVSARVRDIITRNLATPDDGWPAPAAAQPGVEQLTEENKILQVRLSSVGNFAPEVATNLLFCYAYLF